MRILLTNDDGIYAPGLAALENEMRALGDTTVVAPFAEQSGVGHSITYLKPLVAHEVFQGERRRGWAVEGSPADCVKLGVGEFCETRPDLIVSGINSGLNAGINVLYSGTVAASIEGAFFGIPSIAVSLEFTEHDDYARAAKLARMVVAQIVAQPQQPSTLYNVNIPRAALFEEPRVRVVPMGVNRYGEAYEKRIDPRGRAYFWATNDPPCPRDGSETDVAKLAEGWITITPLHFDLTRQSALAAMQDWKFSFGG